MSKIEDVDYTEWKKIDQRHAARIAFFLQESGPLEGANKETKKSWEIESRLLIHILLNLSSMDEKIDGRS